MNKCSICNDDGKCVNDDIYDCVEYLEEKNGTKTVLLRNNQLLYYL